MFAWSTWLLAGCTDAAPASVTPLQTEVIPGDPHGRRFVFETVPDTIRCVSEDGDILEKMAEMSLEMHGFLASTRYECAAGDAVGSFTTDPLPANLALPAVEVPGDAADLGYHLTNVFRNSTTGDGINATDAFLVVYDAQGRPRWQREGAYGADTDVSWVDGTVLVAGYSGDVADTNTRPSRFTLNNEIAWDALDENLFDNFWLGSWNHDAGVSVDGTHLHALGREIGQDSFGYYTGFVVQTISLETGETDDYWASVADGLPAGLPARTYDAGDPWHANAVWETVEDGRPMLWVSLYQVSLVLHIDQTTKEIVDILGDGGGWTLDGDRWFHNQHDVKVIGDRLYAFDNGDGETRILELQLDFATDTATVLRSWTEPGWYIDRWGGVDPVGDALDLARPHWASDEPAAGLQRLGSDNNVEWSLRFADPAVSLYRSETLGPDDIFDIVE